MKKNVVKKMAEASKGFNLICREAEKLVDTWQAAKGNPVGCKVIGSTTSERAAELARKAPLSYNLDGGRPLSQLSLDQFTNLFHSPSEVEQIAVIQELSRHAKGATVMVVATPIKSDKRIVPADESLVVRMKKGSRIPFALISIKK